MGNCAIKPKVLKDSDEDLVPVERDTVAPSDHDKDPAEKSENNSPNAAEDAAAAARRSEKGKEILIEDDADVVDQHKRPSSLSPLIHEDKTVVEKEVTDLSPVKSETSDKTGPSSEVSKVNTSALTASNVKAPEESFDVLTRNDLEVTIPKDSEVKTPETPKAKESNENCDVKFPEELEAKKQSEDVNVAEESKLPQVSEVSAPGLSEVKVTKESDVPEVKNIPEVSNVSAPGLSEIKVTKEPDVPEVLEDKDIPEVSEVKRDEVKAAESELLKVSEVKSTKDSEIKVPEVSEVKTDEVKVAESELLKVSEVKSTEDLEVKVPEVFEVKTPETSNVKVTDESEVKTNQEALKEKTAEETEAPVFMDAQEKIVKSDSEQDREIALPKTEEEAKDVSLKKQAKESTLSDIGNK